MDTSIKYPIIPFQSSYKIQIDLSAGWFNNDYAGKVKCAFAKIPVRCLPYSQIYDSTRAFIANISHYNHGQVRTCP